MLFEIEKNKLKKNGGILNNMILNKKIKTNLTFPKTDPKIIKVGSVFDLKITAIGPKNIGIDEFSFLNKGYSILVPNTKLGDFVKVKIVKIGSYSCDSGDNFIPSGTSGAAIVKKQGNQLNVLPTNEVGKVTQTKVVTTHTGGKKIYKYAVAKVIKTLKTEENFSKNINLTVGAKVNVSIVGIGPKLFGIAEISETNKNGDLLSPSLVTLAFPEGKQTTSLVGSGENPANNLGKGIGYKLIVPNAKIGQKLLVQVTRIKKNYAFGKIVNWNKNLNSLEMSSLAVASQLEVGTQKDFLGNQPFNEKKSKNLKEGSKFNIILPLKVKRIPEVKASLLKGSLSRYMLLKIEGLILFVKLGLGAKLGDKVKIKLIKVGNSNRVGSLALPQVRVGLPSVATKLTKEALSLPTPLVGDTQFAIGKIIQVNPSSNFQKLALLKGSLKKMLQSGMHFGEKAVKCNPRMKNFVWLRKKGQNKNKPLVKKGRNLINLLKTRRCLNKALKQLSKYALKGRTFLFVGTKKPAAGLIARASLFSKTAFFVNTRWLGGMLTNWKTILKSISKIRPILKEKQTVIKDLLEKRQNIKNRLMQKAFILRKKSKVLMKKGRLLIEKLKNSASVTNVGGKGFKSSSLNFAEKSTQLIIKRKALIDKGQQILEKRQKLIEKKKELIKQSLILKEKGFIIGKKYTNLLAQLTASRKKLTELQYLFILSKEIENLKQQNNSLQEPLYTVSYGKLKMLTSSQKNSLFAGSFDTGTEGLPPVANSPTESIASLTQEIKSEWILPNPPKELLNKIVLTLRDQKNTLISSQTNKLGNRSSSIQKDGKILILSKLLSQFTIFIPFLRTSIEVLRNNIQELEQRLNSLKETLNKIKIKIDSYQTIKTKLVFELQNIKKTLSSERGVIRILKRKLKQLFAQQRLIKFLPKLRYLPTPQSKISETVQILMKKIVDPKLKYPIETIYDDKLSNQSKKVAAARKKKWQRLEKYFGGIASMTKMKKTQISQNVAIIVGQQEEINAVRECKKLGIKMFNIVDTNCNPTLADHFIPANDDSRNSIKFLLLKILTHIRLAQKIRLRCKKNNKIKKISSN